MSTKYGQRRHRGHRYRYGRSFLMTIGAYFLLLCPVIFDTTYPIPYNMHYFGHLD